LRRVSKTLNNPDFVGIWAGQSIHDYSELSTEDILEKLIHQAEIIS
jgi:nitronate monooxygenase